jgi:hypothetical protein
MISKERLYLAADKKTVVKAGDPKAAFLLVGEGGEIPDKQALELGLMETEVAEEPAPEKKKAGKKTGE